MRKIFLVLVLTIVSVSLYADQEVKSGKLIEHKEFKSDVIKPRDVYVWLPEDYSPKKRYDVVYMHDGQMLFDAKTTWNKQEWMVDEVSAMLIENRQTRPFIVVGVANIAADRYGDYLPQKALDYLPKGVQLTKKVNANADNYLKFLVEEVKPFIDKNYSTNKGVKSTFVMGSSMGGLISLYALCEYPQIFGGAAAISTHTPMVLSGLNENLTPDILSKAFRDYLSDNLPKANSKKIYMDRGDQTLDATYPKYQDALDNLMKNKGWESPEWVSRVFPNTAHSETDWANRLRTPLQFLLGETKSEKITRVDPTFWWAGMKKGTLQLMIYGNNIVTYEPSIDYPGVKIESVEELESPNYLIIYLNVAEAEAGKFDIVLTKDKKRLVHRYELKEREQRTAAHEGFNSSDVIYLLMPDRFANGDESNDNIPMKRPYKVDRTNLAERHGGDLQGIMNNIDYIEELGATTVWLNPILENDMGEFSYHGYAATDYYKVDPRFGTNQEYVATVDSLHKRGMKIIMDMIFNHCGSYHPWNLDRPMGNWFNNPDKYVQTNHNKSAFYDPYCSEIDMEEMVDGWFVPSMPDFNQRNKFVADYLIQNSIWWIEYVGLNGIRQDTYPYPDYEMMRRWCLEVMNEYPDFNIVGEAWIVNSVGSSFWQRNSKVNPNNTELKSVMDFQLQILSSTAFNEETYWGTGLVKIHEHLTQDFLYPDINNVLRFYENHDTDRFLIEEPENLDAYKQAITFLATIPGIPQIYYGQELLMNGSTKVGGYEAVRKDMPGGWKDDKVSVFEESGRTEMQKEAFNFMSKLLNWRKESEVVAKGSMKHFVPVNGVYVYTREYNGERFIVVMNGVSKENSIDWSRYTEILGAKETLGVNIIDGANVKMQGVQPLKSREILLIELK